MPAASSWRCSVLSCAPGSYFFHVELRSQVGVCYWAFGGAGGIYCTFSRSAGHSVARPAECSMHHAWDNSPQSSDSFRHGPVFLQARQSLYVVEARRSPASFALHVPLLVTAPAFRRHKFVCTWLLKKSHWWVVNVYSSFFWSRSIPLAFSP